MGYMSNIILVAWCIGFLAKTTITYTLLAVLNIKKGTVLNKERTVYKEKKKGIIIGVCHKQTVQSIHKSNNHGA